MGKARDTFLLIKSKSCKSYVTEVAGLDKGRGP